VSALVAAASGHGCEDHPYPNSGVLLDDRDYMAQVRSSCEWNPAKKHRIPAKPVQKIAGFMTPPHKRRPFERTNPARRVVTLTPIAGA